MKQWIIFLSVFLLLMACTRQAEPQLVLTPEQIGQLEAFKAKDKFTPAEWKQRGLQPSSASVIQQMQGVVSGTAEQLLQEQHALTETKVRKIVSAQLDQIGIFDLDTEEKEFLAEEMNALSGMVQVDLQAVILDDLY